MFVIWASIVILGLLVTIGLMVKERFNELEGKLDEILDAIANDDKDKESAWSYEFMKEDLGHEHGWEKSPDESPNDNNQIQPRSESEW